MRLHALDELRDYELELSIDDPTLYTVVGAADFVLGRVNKLVVDLDSCEVVYLVVDTRVSNFARGHVEQRLVPLAWGELVRMRRQVRLPHLSRFGFQRLPLYNPASVPASVAFPTPFPDDPDVRDIA